MSSFPKGDGRIAYFTMEIGLKSDMHTYSGGLGVLAGDTIKGFADLEIPAVGVTLLNDMGYCKQKIDSEGNQIDGPNEWNPGEYLNPLSVRTTVQIEGEEVTVGAWKKEIEGQTGFKVPVIFLDTNLEVNDKKERELTRYLYTGSKEFRLSQEVVLGIGGVKMLHELGYDIHKYHMNESHSSLLGLELLRELGMDRSNVKDLCVFTTHTPIPAGHEKYTYKMVDEVLGDFVEKSALQELSQKKKLHMTLLGLNLSSYANGVSKRNGEVAQKMFPEFEIDGITNGVHVSTWTSDHMGELYDEHIPGWRKNPYKLRHACRIPKTDILKAHKRGKEKLIDYVNARSRPGAEMSKEIFTMGFARRVVPYKRADLIFHKKDKLAEIANEVGEFQVLFAGKAHREGDEFKEIIKGIHEHIEDLKEDVNIAYLEGYDINLAKKLIPGVDLWLNNPERPREASGTSGIKAACNGVPHFSTLDGWWIEGHIEGETGWSIGPEPGTEIENLDKIDAKDFYSKLENKIIPLYYGEEEKWAEIMRNAIVYNGSFFNIQRMIREYVANAYSK